MLDGIFAEVRRARNAARCESRERRQKNMGFAFEDIALATHLSELNRRIAVNASVGSCPDYVLRASTAGLLCHPARRSRLASLKSLLERPLDRIFPPPELVRALVFGPVSTQSAHQASSFGLSVTASTAYPDLAALSVAERHWTAEGRLGLKVRLAAFIDKDERLAWEFGIVATAPSLLRLRQGLDAARLLGHDLGAIIDLTPSAYHAARLAIRLGGRAGDHSAFVGYLGAVKTAARRHAQRMGVGRHSAPAVSLLLQSGALIEDATGAALTWRPNRLLLGPSSSGSISPVSALAAARGGSRISAQASS